MSTSDRDSLDALLRQDFSSFVAKTFQSVDASTPFCHNWHLEVVADRLVRAYQRETKRLIITVSPRSLKSIEASVAFPAWVLGHNPSLRIICASYSGELATKHARDCRSILEADWYRSLFPATRISTRKASEEEFETTAKGGRLATSVGGTLTGRGGHFIIIDDPIKPQDAFSPAKRDAVKHWYDATLYSRLDDKRDDVIILIMQRAHADDLVAHVLEKEPWEHLNLPAIADSHERFELLDGRLLTRAPGEPLQAAREPLEVLENIKSNLGSVVFQCQYLQSPVPDAGNMIKETWFKRYDCPPIRGTDVQIVQSWDTAMKPEQVNDHSVCTTWLVGKGAYFLLDVTRRQADYPTLKSLVLTCFNQYQPNAVIIEDKGSGTALIQDLQSDGTVYPIAYQPQGDKAMRMHVQSAKIEAGKVILPQEAPWLASFLAEVLAFPVSKHDDQVDSLSQFLDWISQRSTFSYEFM